MSLGQRGKWQPTPVFLPGDVHGQRGLQSESDTTERPNNNKSKPKAPSVRALLKQTSINTNNTFAMRTGHNPHPTPSCEPLLVCPHPAPSCESLLVCAYPALSREPLLVCAHPAPSCEPLLVCAHPDTLSHEPLLVCAHPDTLSREPFLV